LIAQTIFLQDSISTANYTTAENLDCTGKIKQQANVTLSESNRVQLKEEFLIPVSATFQINIEACN